MKKLVLLPYHKYEQLQKHTFHNETSTVVEKPEESSADINVGKEEETTDRPDIVNTKLDQDLILSHIPKCNKRKAITLLEYINKSPKLDWNSEGEITIDKKNISGTHITDLLRDCFTEHQKFEPEGVNEFYNHIGNIPLSLITNPKRRILIQKGGKSNKHKSTHSPSSKKKKEKPKSWKMLWKSL
jgi:hypothetical protein